MPEINALTTLAQVLPRDWGGPSLTVPEILAKLRERGVAITEERRARLLAYLVASGQVVKRRGKYRQGEGMG
jgi:hypothetical protein